MTKAPLPAPTPAIDRLRPRLALPLAGLLLAVGLWQLPTLPAALLFAAAVAAGLGLVLRAEPVLEDVPAKTPGSRRGPVPDVWWVPIPAGRFRMGSPVGESGRFDDEGPVHEVAISAFECLRYPVTKGMIRRLDRRLLGRWSRLPLVRISWWDAIRLCNRLSSADGRRPCYRIDEDSKQVAWDRDADGWRLLTEAEWEYACRAGSETRWSFGDDETQLGAYGWYSKNSGGKLHRVGTRRPNLRGLHDMHGLVWEWCWDRHGDYGADPQTDPTGPASGVSRVLRGGAFDYGARYLRSAGRGGLWPEVRDRFIGFRCARVPAAGIDR